MELEITRLNETQKDKLPCFLLYVNSRFKKRQKYKEHSLGRGRGQQKGRGEKKG
jgi:hypothetical protein